MNRELLFAEYLKTTKIYAEPVLITHNGSLNSIYKKYTHNESIKTYDFYTKDKIRHEIWEIKGTHDGYFKEYGILHQRIIKFFP